MENSFPLASNVQGSFTDDLANRRPERGHAKVVMICSHPAWLRDHPPAEEDTAADTVDLVRVFHGVLERMRQLPVLNMDDESVTVGQMIDQIWRQLATEDVPLRLSQILRVTRTERAVICLQLALLELMRLQAILLWKDRHLSDILLKRNSAVTGS